MKTEMARIALSLLAASLPLAAGLGLTQLVPVLRRESFLVRLGWAWLLGAAWIGTGTVFVSLVLGATLRRAAVLPIVVLPIVAGLVHLAASGRREGGHFRLRREPLVLAAAALGAIVTFTLLAEAATNPVRDWDGRMTWGPLARWMRAERTVKPAILTEGWWWVTHPKYPPALPALDVALQESFDLPWDIRSTRPFRTAFYPAVLLVLYGASRRFAGRRAAAVSVLLFLSAPFPAFENHGGAAGIYADLPLGAFYGGGLLLLLLGRRSASAGAAAGLLLAAAALTKNEGLPFALVALGLAAVLGPGPLRRRLLSLGAAATVLLAGAGLLREFKSGIPNRFDEDYFASIGSRLASGRVALNLRAALPVVLHKTFSWPSWILLPVVVPALLVAGRRFVTNPVSRSLAAAAVFPCLLGLGAYAAGFDVAGLADVTWERFMLQGTLPLFVLVAIATRSFLRRAASEAGARP